MFTIVIIDSVCFPISAWQLQFFVRVRAVLNLDEWWLIMGMMIRLWIHNSFLPVPKCGVFNCLSIEQYNTECKTSCHIKYVIAGYNLK